MVHQSRIPSRPHTPFKSIRVVECPEFRDLCMVLREALTDGDIPRHNKMGEAILNQWRESFERTKLELSVHWNFVFLLY